MGGLFKMTEQAADKKAKNLTITILPDEIIGADISRSRDYKYASVGIKRSDDEFLRISYEWKNDAIPDFVMALMAWMTANKEEIDQGIQENAAEYKELKKRM